MNVLNNSESFIIKWIINKMLCIQSAGHGTIALASYLQNHSDKFEAYKDWHAYGTASLILFFKIAGYTYQQIIETLSEMKILGDFFPYNSIVTQSSVKNKEYIRDFLKEHLEKSIFDKSSTLEDVGRLLGVKPSFVLYNHKTNKLEVSSPKDNLLETVLSALCSPSVYNTHGDYGCGLNVYPVYNFEGGEYILSYPSDVTSEEPGVFFEIEKMLCKDYKNRVLSSLKSKKYITVPYAYRKGKRTTSYIRELIKSGK